MFVDASALVAILTGEPERDALLGKLEQATFRATSAIALYETSHALARKVSMERVRALEKVEAFIRDADIELLAITGTAGAIAVRALARYGKGSGHPAGLNMGDCFSYAMAREAGVPLLYKGDDFARTDLA